MAALRFLLDTNILVALIRGGRLSQYIDAMFRPFHQPDPPLLCIVSEAEIRSLAAQFGWAAGKLQALEGLLARSVLVPPLGANLVQAYVEIELASLAHPPGAYVMGKNNLWIAATAKMTGATLLTADKDFDHLHPAHIQRSYIDPTAALSKPPSTP